MNHLTSSAILTKSSLDSSYSALLFAFRFLLNRLLVFLFMTLSVSSFNSLLSVSWFPFLLLASNFEFFAEVFFFRLGSVITVALLILLLLLIIIIVSNYTNTKHPIGKRRVLSSTIISFFSPGKKNKEIPISKYYLISILRFTDSKKENSKRFNQKNHIPVIWCIAPKQKWAVEEKWYSTKEIPRSNQNLASVSFRFLLSVGYLDVLWKVTL